MCLDEEELILPKEPVQPENPTPHQKKVWDLRATAMKKSKIALCCCDVTLWPYHGRQGVVPRDSHCYQASYGYNQAPTGYQTAYVFKVVKKSQSIKLWLQSTCLRTIAPEFLETIYCNETGVWTIMTTYWASRPGGTGNFKKRKSDEPYYRAIGRSNKKSIRRVSCNTIPLPGQPTAYGKILEDMENAVLRKKDSFPKNIMMHAYCWLDGTTITEDGWSTMRQMTGWHLPQ